MCNSTKKKIMKKCTTCSMVFDIEKFHKDKTKKDGVRSECVYCRRLRLKKWRETQVGRDYENRKDVMVRSKRFDDQSFAQRRRDIVNKSMSRPEYKKRQRVFYRSEDGKKIKRATNAVARSIARGELTRPNRCQLCADDPGVDKKGRSKIRAIHCAGYDDKNKLNVTFMCPICVETWKNSNKE